MFLRCICRFAVLGLVFSAVPCVALAQTNVTVVDHPDNGTIKLLPDGSGIVYLGTTATDSFSFVSMDMFGASHTTVSIDMSTGHNISTVDFGGPLPVQVLTFKLVPELFVSLDPRQDEDEGYIVIIKVDQPGNGGDRDPFEIDPVNGPSVGHTFIEVINGQTGEVTFGGLYPTNPVNPITDPTEPGVIRDDTGHDWDVKYEVPITRDQYEILICGIEHDKANPPTYDLNDFNCTDWAIGVLGTIEIEINTNPGVWPGGGGHNTGDLGEDLILIGGTRNTPAPPAGGTGG
ncbi:MAG: hypothetical protein ACK6A8_06890, partial [Planctomycetota bacterium]